MDIPVTCFVPDVHRSFGLLHVLILALEDQAESFRPVRSFSGPLRSHLKCRGIRRQADIHIS
jgi:hypothetical protein